MSQRRRRPDSSDVRDELGARIEREVRDSILGKPRIPEGTVTILFTDVEGSTEMLLELGERDAHAVLRRHDEMLRAVIEGCGGVEVEHPGDSFMVAFPTARAGLTCALKIQRALEAESASRPETPKVRIGIDTGEVITEEHGYFGSTVFRASRIADIAAGGQILVSEPAKALGQDAGFRFAERGEAELKGLGDGHHIFEVTGGPDEP